MTLFCFLNYSCMRLESFSLEAIPTCKYNQTEEFLAFAKAHEKNIFQVNPRSSCGVEFPSTAARRGAVRAEPPAAPPPGSGQAGRVGLAGR